VLNVATSHYPVESILNNSDVIQITIFKVHYLNQLFLFKQKRINGQVQIMVSDNGYGTPQNIIDKIFQPFFTTKPTGERTGLGLSLSYDIIKADDGEIKVETKEGEGTEFLIQLQF